MWYGEEYGRELGIVRDDDRSRGKRRSPKMPKCGESTVHGFDNRNTVKTA